MPGLLLDTISFISCVTTIEEKGHFQLLLTIHPTMFVLNKCVIYFRFVFTSSLYSVLHSDCLLSPAQWWGWTLRPLCLNTPLTHCRCRWGSFSLSFPQCWQGSSSSTCRWWWWTLIVSLPLASASRSAEEEPCPSSGRPTRLTFYRRRKRGTRQTGLNGIDVRGVIIGMWEGFYCFVTFRG